MSIKIYGGVLFTEKNFYKLTKKLKTLSESMQAIALEEAEKKVAKAFTDLVDDYVFDLHHEDLEKPPESLRSYLDIIDEKSKKQTQSTSRFDDEWDFNFLVTLYPLPDGRILGIMGEGGHYDSLEKEFRSPRWIKEYHYQNSTDRPDEVPQKEWTKRKRDWDKALKGSWKIQKGHRYELVPGRFPRYEVRWENIQTHLPRKADRLHRQCKRIAEREFIAANESEFKRLTEEHRYMEYLRKVEDYLKGEKGQARIKDLKSEHQAKIVDITQEQFQGKFTDFKK